MAHLQFMPGDPRLVDQLVYELKSKGIFDQFRKDCIADVDTRPAYQNLRQRVETSVATFLSRQCWKPDLNKNQLREKLRKHILDGNYLEQGVERIVDQVVNPKVASVFIPQVEELVYNYLGIAKKKTVPTPESSTQKVNTEDLLPTDLEAVSPGSVKSNDDKNEPMDTEDSIQETKMDIDEEKVEVKQDGSNVVVIDKEKLEGQDTGLSRASEVSSNDSNISIDKSKIPLPDEIRLENIPPPENSPPKIDLDKIELPKEPNVVDIPLPDEIPKPDKDNYFKPINATSDDDDSSSDSSLRRNMSPLTPIRNFNNENSCDAQQGYENDSDSKSDDKKEPSSFRFALESKSTENSNDGVKKEEKKKEQEQTDLSYQFNNQVNINTFNTPLYEESSNSNNLHIDYESDANSKINNEAKLAEADNSEDSKKERKTDDKKTPHKSSHRSRDSHRHSSSKDKRSDSKQSNSRDNSRHDKKTSKDEHSKSKTHRERERSRDKSEKKDSDSSKHRSSHKSSSHKDSKSHRSSSSSQRHSTKHSDDKKSSSSHKDRSSSDKNSDRTSKDRPRDSKSSSHRDKDKDRKSSSSSSKSKQDDKEKKKDKKDADDHYSLSGRGNHNRRSTDRDSNDGSSSSKGSNNQPSSKTTDTKKETKGSTSKSDNTSTSGDSASPSDKEQKVKEMNSDKTAPQTKPIVRVETHLEVPIASPPRLPFVPDVTMKKPKFAANLKEAKRLMKMRKFFDEEQKRMNQEAALLLEFQANVRPSLSQVYSSIPGPELEFACVTNAETNNQYNVLQEGNIEECVAQELAEISSKENSNENNAQKETEDDITPIKDDAKIENVEEKCVESTEQLETKVEVNSLNDEKPFKDLIDEIAEYRKVSESKTNADIFEMNLQRLQGNENKRRTEFFEVTIITEELSESEEIDSNVTEPMNETYNEIFRKYPDEDLLKFFNETEKREADIEKEKFHAIFKTYDEKIPNKMYLVNCNTYEESIVKEVAQNFGNFEIVNYHKNGHLRLSKSGTIVKNVNICDEITLPLDKNEEKPASSVFSPVKSECSFELSSDYDEKLKEMVKRTSRQQVMEIILGSITEESSTMPTIDYCTESNIDGDENVLKRKCEFESSINNNRPVLTPRKLRKYSESDQISSTTEETEVISNNNKVMNNVRSKYLGRARRVGLPRPKKTTTNLPNSPSSDKSVENYEDNSTPNGKLKPQRSKVQRYDTSDLYKPKLHYLSRRNNIT